MISLFFINPDKSIMRWIKTITISWRKDFRVHPPFLSKRACKICEYQKELESYLPDVHPDMNEIFGKNSSCAIVTGSPALKQYKYGKLIDQHDIVMRLNLRGMEPTDSYGSKTTHMMVNNGFWLEGDKLYQKFDLIKNQKKFVMLNLFSLKLTLKDSLRAVEFFEARNQYLNRTFVLDPQFTLEVTEILQASNNDRIWLRTADRIWPSSGFFSLVILIRVCSSVHGFGFIDPLVNDGHDYLTEHHIFRQWSLDQKAEVKLHLYPPDKTGVPTGWGPDAIFSLDAL